MTKKILSALATIAFLGALTGCGAEGTNESETTTVLASVDRFVLEPNTIELLIEPNTSQPDIDRLGEEIEAMDEVEEVIFVSQEEALEKLRQQLGDDEKLLPAELSWELSPTFEIILDDKADIVQVADRFTDNAIVVSGDGTEGGVRYNTEAWYLDLMSDETFVMQTEDGEITGSYKIFRDSVTLIEESGELGVFEGEIKGTTIKLEAWPGIWEKE